jgi:hypothetical protein
MAGGWYVGARRRRQIIHVRASTGARGTFRRKRSPEKEKSKLIIRRRRIPEII